MKHTTYTLLFLFAISFMACKKEPVSTIQYGGPKFNLDKFNDNLKSSLEPAGSIGWAYVISQNGLFMKGGGFGKARNTADGDLPFTINKKINLASVSKWLTAIAVMQLLEAKGLNENTNITPFLPPLWNKGPNVANLKFSDLLGHTSGLSSYNTNFNRTLTWSGLQRMIDTGVVRNKNYQYLNSNFALFRVMIPAMWKGLPGAPAIGIIDSSASERFYIEYMQKNVFEPIGLQNIGCEDEARDIATLYYAASNLQSGNGVNYGSWTSMAGGGGFYMSTMELAKVLAYYKHTEILISKNSRTTMEVNRFGYERQDNALEVQGTYLPKNGSISNSLGQGVLTQIVSFPNGVEVTVVFNTQGLVFANGQTNIRIALYDAYNKSWE